MITIEGTIPFPPGTNAQALTAFGASCTTLAKALKGASAQVTAAANTAGSNWTGVASTSFASHMTGRSQGLTSNAVAIARIEPIISLYAKAMTAAETDYNVAVAAQQAAMAALPFSAAAEAAAIAAEAAAVIALETAGMVCAGALATVIAQLGIEELMAFDTSLVSELEQQLGNAVTGVIKAGAGLIPQDPGGSTPVIANPALSQATVQTLASKPTTLAGYLQMAGAADTTYGKGTIAIVNTGNNNWVIASPGIQDIPNSNGTVQNGINAAEQIATGTSSEENAIKQAMQQAGVPQGANLMFVVHSQGGLGAFDLANDPSFTSQYNVTHIFTAGSPIGDEASPAGTQTLSLQNDDDLITHLNNTSESSLHPTYHFADEEGGISANHSLSDVYVPEAASPAFTNTAQTQNFTTSASAYLQPGSATVQYFHLSNAATPVTAAPQTYAPTPVGSVAPPVVVLPPSAGVPVGASR